MKILGLMIAVLIIYTLIVSYYKSHNTYLVSYTLWPNENSHLSGYITLEHSRVTSLEELTIFIDNIKHKVDEGDDCHAFIVNNISDLGRVSFF